MSISLLACLGTYAVLGDCKKCPAGTVAPTQGRDGQILTPPCPLFFAFFGSPVINVCFFVSWVSFFCLFCLLLIIVILVQIWRELHLMCRGCCCCYCCCSSLYCLSKWFLFE